jgi:hypothetical protein
MTDYKKILTNVSGTASAGMGLAAVISGVDWTTILGILFACAANLIGLLQQPPMKRDDSQRFN